MTPQEELELIDIELELRRRHEKPAPPRGGPLTALASGVNKGALAYLPGIAGDTAANIMDLLKAGAGVTYGTVTGKAPPEALDPVNRAQLPLTSAWIFEQLKKVPGGQSVLESGSADYPILHAGGSALGASLGGARAAPARTTIAAFSSGAAGEATREITDSNEAAILASLLTPVAQATGTTAWQNRLPIFRSTAARQAEQALRPYTPQEIRRGIELQRTAENLQTPIAASQAIGGGGRIADLESYVYSSPHVPRSMLHDIQTQPKRAGDLANRLVGTLGRPNRSLARANEIEAAADRVLDMPRELAGKSVQAYYDALANDRPQLPVSVRFDIANRLNALNERIGLLEESSAGSATSNVASTATQKSPIVSAKGKPFELAQGDIVSLDNYLKELRTRIDGLTKVTATSKDLVERAGLKPAAAEIRQALIENSDILKQAKTEYHQIKNTLDQVVRSTAVPDISRRFNTPETSTKAAANWSTLEKMLTKQQSPQDLRLGESMIGRFDPNALADITRNKINDVFDKHFRDVKPSSSAEFANEVKSIPNIMTAIELTARAKGVSDPKAAVAGFNRLLEVVEASGRQRGTSSTGMTPRQVEQSSPERSAASLMFGHAIAAGGTIVRNVQYMLNKREIQTLISNLNSPRSLEKLAALSKTAPGNIAFQRILRELTMPDQQTMQGGLFATVPITQGLLSE